MHELREKVGVIGVDDREEEVLGHVGADVVWQVLSKLALGWDSVYHTAYGDDLRVGHSHPHHLVVVVALLVPLQDLPHEEERAVGKRWQEDLAWQ